MTWICNAPTYAVDIVRMGLPGGFYRYSTGPPRDYRGHLTKDPLLSTLIGLYLAP